MCGDFDEETIDMERETCERFLTAARRMIGHDAAGRRTEGLGTDMSRDDLHGYMSRLLAEVLGACVDDIGNASEPNRYGLIRAQAVVFARLGGFLAAQLPASQDPLRDITEAAMDGYAMKDEPSHNHQSGHHH